MNFEFKKWSITYAVGAQIIPIDGKTIRQPLRGIQNSKLSIQN
ncbi:hypothetical protein COO91_10335 (plasmid) [Nostoc flagelliforme CCNUN1]|uniref:Uncharacterized protein n=1 Tax=Nostoc flagelliforme CCNUN1 TaxID=2038116 RepID=A0A2K8T8T5_9NOSO|nr:hypothetical protein COO91_10335 [Nostoc flagelliforme CCNUN1]